MSSTAREVVAFIRILEEASTKHERLLQGGSVLLTGDNQGAVAAVNKFRSKAPDVNSLLKQIFALCSEKDFDIVAQWRPREELQLEDDLSKLLNSSDWGLRKAEREAILEAFQVRPVIDLFASDVWHTTSRFVSHHATPGALAVDATRQAWTELVQQGDFAWIFPPVRLLTEVMQAVRRFETNCILIVPKAEATNWWITLLAMGQRAKLAGPLEIPRSTDICIPSRRVPKGTTNPAMFKLRAFRLTW
jgi:hypothetical protein